MFIRVSISFRWRLSYLILHICKKGQNTYLLIIQAVYFKSIAFRGAKLRTLVKTT